MRILHIIQRYYPATGGAEGHLGVLSAGLASAGHEVTVATTDALDMELLWNPAKRRLAAPTAVYQNVTIRRFPVRHLPAPALAYAAVRRLLWLLSRVAITPVPWLHYLARLTPYVPAFYTWLKTTDQPFDLVAGMTITYESLLHAALTFARQRHIPFVIYPLTHLGAGSRPGADSLSRFYTMRHQIDIVRQSDAVVAQTASEKSYYVNKGVAADDIRVVGPGITPGDVAGGDGDRFRSAHALTGPIVLAISSMSADKGTVTTVEAIRRLWRAGTAVELVLIGAVLAPFADYVATLPDADRHRLRLLGPVDDASKRDALAAATLLALPSRTDSFGIVYLEAWLYGKPVIAAQSWGVMDVVRDGENGLVVPFGDAAALATAVKRLLDEPDLAHRLGAHGRKMTLDRHTWPQKYDAVAHLYRQLVSPPASAPA